jgi:3-oxoacyl-[acyl-carrier-protein] synthase III
MGAPSLHLCGIGRAIPEPSLDGESLGAPPAALQATGFARVRSGGEARRTVELWAAAARTAMTDARVSAAELAGVVAVRSGHVPEQAGAWMSLVLAGRLGIADPICLDVHGAGCAGALHALGLASSLCPTDPERRLLVVGGGASGYSRRWFADPPDVEPAGGILVGDAAYAMVAGRGAGVFEVTAVEALLDPALATAWRRPGQDYEIDDDDLRSFLQASRPRSTRVVLSVMMKSAVPATTPLHFVGTNSGRDLKRQLCNLAARGNTAPRLAAALEIQLGEMAEHGHLFGGDTVSNLCAIRDAGLLHRGDHILALEVGGTYLYTAAMLRVT